MKEEWKDDARGAGDQENDWVVKLRGLPWSATTDEILKFFKDCTVVGGKGGIHMTTSREGRPSGEAFVEFEKEEDVHRAVQKDRDHMGNRYIEVFKVNRAEMDWVIKRCAPMNGSHEDGCVRLRGLPFGCSKEEIAQFFTGLEIVPNGITLLTDCSGRSSGEAYVQFVNKEVAEKALLKHREKIGHRYIEIFRSSLSEVSSVVGMNSNNNRRMGGGGGGGGGSGGGGGGGGGSGLSYNSRPSPYDRGDRYGNMNRFQPRGSRNFKGDILSDGMQDRKYSDFNNFDNMPSPWLNNNMNHNNDMNSSRNNFGGNIWGNNSVDRGSNGGGGGGGGGGMHCVHMRGLPFKANQMDVADFFRPIIPVTIRLLQDNSGRASGEADVEFASHDDAVRAMSKDKGHMQHRYIELFLNSSPSGGGGGGGNMGGGYGNGNGGNNGGGYLSSGYGGYGGGPGRRRL